MKFVRAMKFQILAMLSIMPIIGLNAQKFEFKKGDVVAFMGNSLADRLQHDAWLETALQAKLKGMNVTIRNMGFSGDLVDKAPRNKGSWNQEQYLKHIKASVIFMFTHQNNRSFKVSI